MEKNKIGIVGGLGSLAGADVFSKLLKSTPVHHDQEHFDIIFEQHPFKDVSGKINSDYDPRSRKFYIYNTIKELEKRDVDVVMLPCFISHTFIDELQPEVKPKILNILDALSWHLEEGYPQVNRIGVLTSPLARRKTLYERHFPDHEIIHLRSETGEESLVEAIYGVEGIRAGNYEGRALESICKACNDLATRGAEIILPGFTEIPVIVESIRHAVDVPIVDSNDVYAKYTIAFHGTRDTQEFRLGIIGGIGPAATVDFMNKVIEHTDAGRDQDHIKMVVEHNPQIPDRTENLLNDGADPIISMYAACKKLEAGGAEMIAIPCNTAHAFVDRIQSHISIPIINMLRETANHIRVQFPAVRTVGLLATSGTVESGIYRDAIEEVGLSLITPDAGHQQLVMNSIYGEKGVKAGHINGQCKDNLLSVLAHLARKGAQAAILGCTELPLILPGSDSLPVADKLVPLMDPTSILAKKCVDLSRKDGVKGC